MNLEIVKGDSALFTRRDVQIWGIWLTAPDSVVGQYQLLLSVDERQRSDRFGSAKLKSLYVLSRSGLRILLGHYLNSSPEKIELTHRPNGKPELRSAVPLRFNVSHSGQMAVYAFTVGCELGIDIEELRPLEDAEAIAARHFSNAEISELRSLEGEERNLAFFRCWTRKEAYLKAIGEGLTVPLDLFQVTLLPETPARLVHIGGDIAAAGDWIFHNLDMAPGYVGAYVYRDKLRPVTIYPMIRADELPELLA